MPLHLVHGPPNSGRAGIVRERFQASLRRDPMLVLPNLDDVFAFERELCGDGGALVGGSILVFEGLFGEVARTTGAIPPATLTAAQRLRLARAAIDDVKLGPLRVSATRPGFAAALVDLIGDLQAAGLSPEAVAGGASTLEGSAYLDDLTALYAAFARLRDSRGHADSHTVAWAAIAALRQDPDAWGGRPVLLYGFNDLTVEQLELIGALSVAAEVTVSLTYEDRAALSDRARLLQQLRELGPETMAATEADPGHTDSPLLFHIERAFLREDPPRIEPGEGLTLLRSAGDRGEAELIGSEIARLLADGVEPDEIAIALRDPAGRGAPLAGVLREFGIPVALEAELRIAQSGTGGCLIALLRAAFTTRSAADLLTYLRGPGRAGPGRVDRLERWIRRKRMQTAEQALDEWERKEPLHELHRLRESAGEPRRLLAEVAALARDIAQWPIAREDRKGELPDSNAAHELRVGERIAGAAEELAELEGLEPGPEELIATLEALTMRSWSGPAEGRVRIASPYDLRASRFRHLFVASLQDGEFPRHRSEGPFLSAEQRVALGLPELAEAEAEERYLFHVCLSRPTHGLHLSYRTSDESGGAEPPSPFLEEVRRLLDPPPPDDLEDADPLQERLTRARGLGDVLFDPSAAPSEAELARSLAAGPDPEAALGSLEVDPLRAARLRDALGSAAETESLTAEPGPLRVEAVLEKLREVPAYGGTTLETFDVCSYRWFADHELRPQPLDPKPDPLVQGGLMHRSLELLYREAPGNDSIPRPADVDEWVSRGREIVDEVTAELSGHPADRAMRRRVERLLVAFVRREAARENPRLRPSLLEAGFGEDEDADRPSLEIGDWALHGQIDRVDVGDGAGLVIDYKLAREVTPVAKFVEEGKLQLPLYLLALRDLWEIDVLGGIYQPLRPTSNPRPRGVIREEEGKELLGDLGLYGPDMLSPEAFEQALDNAAARATAAVTRMRSGDIKRDPGPPEDVRGHNQCPRFCGFAPICRRERAPFVLPEDEEEEEAT